LVQKLEADALSETEYAELIQLCTDIETRRNKRVKFLIDLAQLRAISLPELMNTLGKFAN
jgi:hypothetical protein